MENSTYLLTLIAGCTCFGINISRFVTDGADFRQNSLLRRQIGTKAFRRVRLWYFATGLLFSGHHWILKHRVCCFTTVLLHITGSWLLLEATYNVYRVAMPPPSAPPSAPPSLPPGFGVVSAGGEVLSAFVGNQSAVPELRDPLGADGALRTISIGFLVLLALLWLRDGLLLMLGRVDLAGERIEIVEEDDVGDVELEEAEKTTANDEDEEQHLPIEPPARWKTFRTVLGSKYYYDPQTEFVHYLTANGRANYAVDPIHNRSYTYDSLLELEQKVEALLFGGDGTTPNGGNVAVDEQQV